MNFLQIPVHVYRHANENALNPIPDTEFDISLLEKMKEYIGQMGYSNPNLYNIFLQLLTKGKILVDFKFYTERLEIRQKPEEAPSLQTVADALNQSIENFKKTSKIMSSSKITQAVIIQSRVRKELRRDPRPYQ